MCGIFTSLSKNCWIYPSSNLKQLLCNRGPDHVGQNTKTSSCGNISLLFSSTVLALRGGHVVTQPLVDADSQSTLCWNGEAWSIGDIHVEGNDGEAIIALLTSKASDCSRAEAITHVLKVLRSICGPSAFIFHDASHDVLYFGRDCLGRRSLLYNIEDVPGAVQFSSVADSASSSWKEVEADGIYALDLTNNITSPSFLTLGTSALPDFPLPLYRYCWDSSADVSISIFSLGKLNPSLPQEIPILNTQAKSVQDLKRHLSESLKLRVLGIPKPPHPKDPNDTSLAVLFSGGLDCTVLARIVHELLPLNQCIDLLNVAFENPRVVEAAKKQQKLQIRKYVNDATNNDSNNVDVQRLQSAYEACPDRATGRNALNELREVCPSRKWRFVEINIPYEETTSHREKVISLIYPHKTEMDLSIAYSLYFASRGIGDASTSEDATAVPYRTPARVLLSGLGADELFGGYTRHGIAYSRDGFHGLIKELELDVNRLGSRNLGRDDRVMSNWGREVRYPYLDDSLIRWALNCPVWGKCGFGTILSVDMHEEPDLEPDKKVLRLLAWKLGMRSVAKEKKRAIQFGTRTAKMNSGRIKGTTLIS